MATSIWGDSESYANDAYPSSLLKRLLQQMMRRFTAQGACLALFDEHVGQMRAYLHLRLRHAQMDSTPEQGNIQTKRTPGRRITPQLTLGMAASTSAEEEVEDVPAAQCELFAPGTAYPIGQDLIGRAWEKNSAYVMSHEDYKESFYKAHGVPPHKCDITPTSYLVVPIASPLFEEELHDENVSARVMSGVVVLYRDRSTLNIGFPPEQRTEAFYYTERIALCLHNHNLRREQRRTTEYLRLLQEISTAFPTTVMLADLVEKMYRFTRQVVDVSSMLLTLYDRDMEKIFDVFAVWNGTRIDDLAEQPVIMQKEDRPVWWQVIQVDNQMLYFSPFHDRALAARYRELLNGAWGDQQHAETFLILPMTMFNRVIGSLSITSMKPNAYHPQEIQVLETMLQIVTVSIENAKLYERDRHLLNEARQREAQLAAINSALQSISSVLNVNELLNKLVRSIAQVINVDVCVFFLLSPGKEQLIAQALYAPSNVRMVDDGSGLPDVSEMDPEQNQHNELIKMIRLPFKGTILEQMVHESFFYLDGPKLEELAQHGEEGGVIFLQETGIQQMLMIPMLDNTEFIGILTVATPGENRFFRPKEIAILLATCAQAVNAVRSAQLFQQREEAYAELQRMDKLKDEFLVTASHELRTPLSAISGYSSLLKRHAQSPRGTPQEIIRFANKIASAAQQLNDQVDKMTDAAKMGSLNKKLDMVSEAVHVRSAVEIAINMLVVNIEQQLTSDVDGSLWVRGDAPYLRQVLSNLLENAAKYSPPHTEIHLSAEATTLAYAEGLQPEGQIDHLLPVEQKDTPVVLVRVKDQGEGISPQYQQRVFEKFYRIPRSLTTPIRGSGLGLYICRRYIEAMGGKLWLESSVPNEGSTFSLYLPQVKPLPEGGRSNEQRDYAS
ncbi:MAG TPA: ATP-binding protein [Ktedonobacteraceae bacterium]